ncbi:MAG TPA: DPP IV N-terminal domain-containing protein [Thermoleophilaceae bacterium]|jgi:dipeptidyl aminopeptidase/acylaminoacyl peptidase
MTRTRQISSAAAAAISLVAAFAVPADATYPGENGRLAVAFQNDEGRALYTLQPDGSGRVRLTAANRGIFDPSWSADGTKIVFQDRGDLYVAASDGGDEVRVTSDGKSLHPVLSPDGKRIAFVHDEYPSFVVQTMNLDGSDRRTIGAGSPFDAPSFSPDGRLIAFSREGRASQPDENGYTAQTFRIVVADLATGAEQAVTPEPVRAHGPSFSPDSRRIVYSGNNQIHVMDAGGGGDVTLPAPATFWESAPVFSPDGEQIAYGSGARIGIVDADGSNPRSVELGGYGVPEVDWQPLDPPPFTPPAPPEPPAPVPSPEPCSQARSGTAGANRLTGTGGGDLIRGLAGDDRLSGAGGADCLFGGAGDDLLSGGPGNDRLDGFRGDDVLKGGTGRDRFSAGTGRDRVNARDGVRETVDCGPSRDTAVVDALDVVRRCERVLR